MRKLVITSYRKLQKSYNRVGAMVVRSFFSGKSVESGLATQAAVLVKASGGQTVCRCLFVYTCIPGLSTQPFHFCVAATHLTRYQETM